MLIDEIESQIKRGKNIEDVLEKYDWKTFEGIVNEIFSTNGFAVKQNFRFKTKRRYEIDIIAVKQSQIVCIDCKWWGRGRYKKTGLKKAIGAQERRAKEFKKFLKGNVLAKSSLKMSDEFTVSSLIVTLHDEDMIKESETFVVPAWKLNGFVNEYLNIAKPL